MKTWLAILFAFSSALLHAQPTWVERARASWTEAEIEKANTAAQDASLTQQEKDLVLLMNLSRLNGRKFWNTLAQPYLAGTGEDNRFTRSLVTDLEKVANLTMLNTCTGLFQSARAHALDMGRTGEIGHDSTDGTRCFDRVRKYYNKSVAMAENCSYGYADAMDILMQLLVDEGVPSLGHRKNILSPAYQLVGLSIQRHKTYQWNCVMDFAGG